MDFQQVVAKQIGKFGGKDFEGSGSVYWVESCTVLFLWRHFLFTCSDTFAVGCIVYSQCTVSQTNDVMVPTANSRSYCMQVKLRQWLRSTKNFCVLRCCVSVVWTASYGTLCRQRKSPGKSQALESRGKSQALLITITITARICTAPPTVLQKLGHYFRATKKRWRHSTWSANAKSCTYTGLSMSQTQKYPLVPAYHLLWTSSEDVVCQYSAT